MHPCKPFEDCLEKITYTTKIQRKDFLESGDFPIVSQEIGDINGYWNNESDVFKIKKPIIVFGDHTKIIKYIDFDFVLGADGVKILQPKDFLDTRYFYYFLQSLELKSLGYARHYRLLRELNVPIPPLSTQLNIVAHLDSTMAEIEALRAETESTLANTRELWESTLESIFVNGGKDWEIKNLGEIGKISMCKRILKEQTLPKGDIPFYKIGTFGKEANAFISKIVYEEYRSKYSFPKKGDILISASGTIGRCVRYDGKPAYFQDSNIVWIDNDEKKVTNDYLYKFYEFCDWNPSKGATISRLYNDDLRKIRITFPSLSEQFHIVAHLDTVRAETERLEKIYTEKLASLDELRKSILQEAFS